MNTEWHLDVRPETGRYPTAWRQSLPLSVSGAWEFCPLPQKLQENPRIGVMYRTWDRMPAEDRRELLRQAGRYKQHLNGP